MRTRFLLWATAAVAALAPLERGARADSADTIGDRLTAYEAEVGRLAAGVRAPGETGGGGDVATRRTMTAETQFGKGNVDDAAIILYDVVEKYPDHRIYDEALYYLAESLFQKGDYIASRTYFSKLVKERGAQNRFYQQSLERLIELTQKLDDAGGAEEWIALIEAVPAAERRASVPYVRGKYAFYSGNYDEAITRFSEVVKRSKYYFQSRYFIGASYIAKKDLAKAVTEYQNLVAEKPRTEDDERVVELSQIALGRLHYEREQPSKAIDRYLEVSRHSDLFDETVYEASWVYVRNKDFEKALTALELLGLSDPGVTRLPEVKTLEGNLRIRKAEKLADIRNKPASEKEYGKANANFLGLRAVYAQAYADLNRLIADKAPPGDYLAQVTGRHASLFEVHATMPEVAAAWLRDEPEVKRIVAVENDLGDIESDIAIAEKTIVRLELAFTEEGRINLFPTLATKRVRAAEIQDNLNRMRGDLAGQLRGAVGSDGEIDRLRAEREGIARQMAGQPDGKLSELQRVARARGVVTKQERVVAEADAAIFAAEAQLAALEKYVRDGGYKGSVEEMRADLGQNRAEIEAMKLEAALLRDDLEIARDRAGGADETSIQRRELRQRLRAALDAELGRLTARAGGNAGNLVALARRASTLALKVDQMDKRIDEVVEAQLAEANATIADEKAKLAAYKAEYLTLDGETHAMGADTLGGAMAAVSTKLYDVLIRADVGVVDVAWSLKEGADRALRALTLEQARETRTLDAEFADVIREIREKREAENAAKQAPPAAPAPGGTP